jgi:hypothetical protein
MRGTILISATVLLLNVAILWVLGVDLFAQGMVVLALAALALVGSVFLWRSRRVFPDRFSFYLCALLLGLFAAFGLLFAAYHQALCNLFGIASIRGATLVCAIPLAMLAVIGVWLAMRDRSWTAPWTATRMALPFALLAALGISAATCYGAFNELVAESSPIRPLLVMDWGHTWDKPVHMVQGPEAIVEFGFPLETDKVRGASGVYGLQVLLTALAQLGHSGLEVGAVQSMKWLVFFTYTALFYLFFSFSRTLFELPVSWALLGSAAVLVFGPIHPEPFQFAYSSFLGFIWSSGGMYHNLPQLLSLALGAAGIFLVLSSIGSRGDAFVAGAVLITGSFFFKPSLYTAAGPAIFLWIPLYERRFEWRKILGYLALLFPIVYAIGYPLLFDVNVKAKSLNPAISPFEVLFHYNRSFAPFIADHPVLRATAIVACSLAAPLFVATVHVKQAAESIWSGRRHALVQWLRERVPHLVLGTIFTLGLGNAILLVEQNSRKWDENFIWVAAAAYQLAIPVLLVMMRGIERRGLRWTAFALFALHLWGGMHHLGLFVRGSFMHPL